VAVTGGSTRRKWRSRARGSRALAGSLARLGARIRELRVQGGLTQEQVAELARLDAKHMQAIEMGRENVTMATLVAISKALGVKLADLFSGV
jgi:transcriptional regulator with XRE-family HTH domain